MAEPDDELYKGAHKLIEECGELIQALSKMLAPSTKAMSRRHQQIEEEIADVVAAIKYVIRQNPDISLKADRVRRKYRKFKKRGLPGIDRVTLSMMEIESDSGQQTKREAA